MVEINKDIPKSISEEAEQALKVIDSQLEEMLAENASISHQGDSYKPDEIVLESINTRRKVSRSREDINQIYELSAEELEGLYNSMLEGETSIFNSLLELLTKSISFTGGMQKFLNVVINQLKLGDIDLKQENFDPIMQQFLDLRILMLLLDSITKGEHREALKSTEVAIYDRLIFNYFKLPAQKERDPVSETLTSLQRTLSSSIKDLGLEISKGSFKQHENQTQFLRRLEDSFKKAATRMHPSK